MASKPVTENLPQAAIDAANGFNNVVDHLVMKELVKGVNPDLLKGFAGVTRTDDTQVAARNNEDMQRGNGQGTSLG